MEKQGFWIGIIAVVLIIMIALISFGQRLDKENMLDLDSDTYLDDINSKYNETGFLDLANKNASDKEENPLLAGLSEIPVIGEILGVTSFLVGVTKDVWDFFKLVFNIPSFMIIGLGIPVGGFSSIINIIGSILFIGLTIFIIRLVR